MRSAVLSRPRKQLPIGDHRVPWPKLVLQENAILVERVLLENPFGLFLRVGLVDDERAAIVREWPGGGELALFAEAGQVLPMHRTVLLDLGLVLAVFDDSRELHGADLAADTGMVKG